MAQADQTVQNATFPTVRADINNNLAALFSANSGNTAPTVTVAFQDWIDTSGASPLWKKRNAANNAWITLATINGNDITFEGALPDQSGNSGKYLSTDGTDAIWAGTPKVWVNFNGTGVVAVRASFNVSSITDNGVGDYTVNFATALVDANYAVVATSDSEIFSASVASASAVNVVNLFGNDAASVYAAVFR